MFIVFSFKPMKIRFFVFAADTSQAQRTMQDSQWALNKNVCCK